jgi:hypothetical protein
MENPNPTTMEHQDFKIIMNEGAGNFETLKDILPPKNTQLRMLIIAKRPAPVSVAAGHYFQGNQGKIFWGQLKRYGILEVRGDQAEDSALSANRYGIMDIVKMPSNAGIEPSFFQYKQGVARVRQAIDDYKPGIVLFVYKPPLEKLLAVQGMERFKINYGFNPHLDSFFNGSKVFLCPLPGVGAVTREEIDECLSSLKMEIDILRQAIR